MMDIALDEVIFFDAITSDSSGAAVDADSTPTFSVFEEANDTPILSAQNFTKRTALDGNYRGTATLSAANGFEVGKWYSVVASATVDSVAGKAVVKSFRVVPAENTAGVPIVDVGYVDGEAAETAADALELADTTIATLATQVSFTLTAGSADDDAYNGCAAVFIDQSTSTQRARCIISDYTGATKTVTLAAAPEFTIATGDTVKVVMVPKQLGNAGEGLTEAGGTGDHLTALPAGTLTSAYDFAKGTVAMTESYAANGAAPTPIQAQYAMHQMLMAFLISGTSYTVKKLDGSTTAFVVTLNDDTDPTGAARS
jgi:hypothetical protein